MSKGGQTAGGIQQILKNRRDKKDKLDQMGWPPFPNGLVVTHTTHQVRAAAPDPVESEPPEGAPTYRLGGRILRYRKMGKASFLAIQDRAGQIQVQFRKDILGEDEYKRCKQLDLGDIIVVEGPLFTTRTQELTIQAHQVQLATKSLHPLPDKHGGLVDVESRYRQRYVDLIVNDKSRSTFHKRSRLIRYLRKFLDTRDFLEVETPMLHDLVSGAAAKPFSTHHNALDMDLFLRIAPELHLKRLVVGGFDRVYEIARTFRNEGLSTQHNPEFTMLEFYCAFTTYEDLMNLTEEMFRGAALEVTGSARVPYGGWDDEHPEVIIDLEKPFRRLPVRAAVLDKIPGLDLSDPDAVFAEAKARGFDLEPARDSAGERVMDLFEHLYEPELIQPTFVVDFPVEVSPLSRRNDKDPTIADRFELYITGREMVNAFSELNDPDDQRARFQAQVAAKAKGAAETMDYDEDYCHALEIGLPPTAGEGVGVDRLAMLLTNSASIRDVILFPLLRRQ